MVTRVARGVVRATARGHGARRDRVAPVAGGARARRPGAAGTRRARPSPTQPREIAPLRPSAEGRARRCCSIRAARARCVRSSPTRSLWSCRLPERVLAGQVRYFGYPEVVLGRPIDWSRDGVTGFDWPDVPARTLDHRTAPADPKWIWELNRLQHLPWLAQAYLFTGREEFAEACDGAPGLVDRAEPRGSGDRLARCVRGGHPSDLGRGGASRDFESRRR